MICPDNNFLNMMNKVVHFLLIEVMKNEKCIKLTEELTYSLYIHSDVLDTVCTNCVHQLMHKSRYFLNFVNHDTIIDMLNKFLFS